MTVSGKCQHGWAYEALAQLIQNCIFRIDQSFKFE